jgi:hypothetical protein
MGRPQPSGEEAAAAATDGADEAGEVLRRWKRACRGNGSARPAPRCKLPARNLFRPMHVPLADHAVPDRLERPMMPDAQPGDAESVTLDLRSGRSIWELAAEEPSPARPLVGNVKTDVIIVGAGITGSFLAERLTRAGREVVVLDRHEPQLASTAASTALLQWEIDAPMLELEDRLGFDRASRIYRQSRETVRTLSMRRSCAKSSVCAPEPGSRAPI